MLYLMYMRPKDGSAGTGGLFIISVLVAVVGGLIVGEHLFWTGFAGTMTSIIFG